MIKKIGSAEELFNPNRPKVVIDQNNNTLYFSPSPIQFIRGSEERNWTANNNFWAHIGMHAFRTNTLQEITKLQQGKLEIAESLEQLRWLENGFKIKTAETTTQSIGIETPEDLEAALKLF